MLLEKGRKSTLDKLELLEIIAKGEDSFTELKEDIESPDEVVAEICAFANSKGGRLILGVSDEGEIVGLKKDWSDEISNWITTKLDPPLEDITIQKFLIEEKLIIVVEIPIGSQKPYALLRRGTRDYWVRFGSTKRKATYEELRRLYQASLRISGDEIPVAGTSMEDIDMEYFSSFFQNFFGKSLEEELESGISLEKLLTNMRIVADSQLTTAGLLIFGKNPQRFLPYCIIWAVRFKGCSTTEPMIDKKEIRGKLNDQIEEAEKFFKNHLNLKGDIKDFEREEKYEIPLEALRESIVNAVAHRDYTVRSNIRIFIFDDRVEIISPGELPNTVTLENIRYGIHVERNPIIVSYLTKFKKMEQIGTGIPRMISLTKKETGHEPEFSVISGEFKVTFWRGGNEKEK